MRIALGGIGQPDETEELTDAPWPITNNGDQAKITPYIEQA